MIFDIPLELKPETLFDKEHNDTLARLQYVKQLVDSLVTLAQAKSSPLQAMLQQSRKPNSDPNLPLSDAYKRAEQLVVFVRALHMLSSALQLAQQEVNAKRLHVSTSVKQGNLSEQIFNI